MQSDSKSVNLEALKSEVLGQEPVPCMYCGDIIEPKVETGMFGTVIYMTCKNHVCKEREHFNRVGNAICQCPVCLYSAKIH